MLRAPAMARRWAGVLGALAVAATASGVGMTLTGCRSCESKAAVVAKLGELHGTATRGTSTKTDGWTPAPVGATFVIGDALHTGQGAAAKVDLTAGGTLKLGENTLVRFLTHPDPSGASGVGVETGEAEVETGPMAIGIETPAGLARFEPNSRVRIRATATDSRFDVVVGRAEIEGDAGVTTTLETSQHLVVASGQAVIEGMDAGPLPDAAATPAPADASEDAPSSNVVEAEVRGTGVKTAAKGSSTLTPMAEGRVDVAEGSRLVVPEGATVAVARGGERAVVVGHAEVVVGHAGGPLLESRTGQVVLTSQSAGTRIDVPGGSILLTAVGPGSRQAQIRVDRQATHVTAEAGQVEIHGRLGVATVSAGESGTVDAKGSAQVESNEPTSADLDVPGGESSTIHSPKGAAAVRLHIDGVCDGDALVEVTSGHGKRTVFVHGGGPAAAVVALGVGSFGDRVRCVDSQGRPGEARQPATLRVVRDSGAQPVPRTAPHDVGSPGTELEFAL